MLRAAGHAELAEEIDAGLVGRNVLPDRWTYQVVEEYDDGYWSVFREYENKARQTPRPAAAGTCTRPGMKDRRAGRQDLDGPDPPAALGPPAERRTEPSSGSSVASRSIEPLSSGAARRPRDRRRLVGSSAVSAAPCSRRNLRLGRPRSSTATSSWLRGQLARLAVVGADRAEPADRPAPAPRPAAGRPGSRP